jgi:hypothetical protein
MKVSKEHYNIIAATVGQIVTDAIAVCPDIVSRNWEAAKQKAKKDPILFFTSCLFDPCLRALSCAGNLNGGYGDYNDDHIFTAMKSVLKTMPETSFIFKG